MSWCVTLPWPPKALSPNARGHWAKAARAKKAYRAACAWEAKAAGFGRMQAQALSVCITFIPPSRHRRDLDNLLASIKSGLDGLADVIGVDDSKWSITIRKEDRIGGMVRVEIA